MRIPMLGVAIAATALATAAPATAQLDALKSVPADAPFVVQIKGLEAARGRLGEMLGNALPDMAPALNARLKETLEEGPFHGRDLSAIDTHAPIFAAFLDLDHISDDPPSVGFLIPVTDGRKFRETFLTAAERETLKSEDGVDSARLEDGSMMYLADKGKYVMASPTREDLKKLTDPGRSLDATIGQELGEAFLACDVAGYLNLRQINEKYKDEIQGFKQLMEFALQSGAGGLDKSSADAAKAVFEGLFRVLEDGTGVVFGVEFRPEGANLAIQAGFGSDTKTNETLKQMEPSPLSELADLPSGQMLYSGSLAGGPIMDALAGLSLDDEQTARLTERHKKAGVKSQFNTGDFPAAGLKVTLADDPAEIAAAELEMLQAIDEDGTYQSAVLKGKPVVKENAETYRDFRLNYAELRFDLEKMLEDNPGVDEDTPEEFRDAMKSMLEKMIGESTRVWFGTDGKVSLQVTAADWAAARKLIDDYLDAGKTIGRTEAFKLTREHLPKEATMLGLAEAGRFTSWTFDYVGSIMQALPGAPPVPAINPTDGEPAFIGFSVVLKKDVGRLDLFVPTTAVQQVRSMIEPLFNEID